MSLLEQQLQTDLELALNLIVAYQRQLYTLNAPDSSRAPALELLERYRIDPYKASDGYRVIVEGRDGKLLDISGDPEGTPLKDGERLATDFTTGKTKVVHEDDVPHTIDRTKCPKHDIPLMGNGNCHRCVYEDWEPLA
jgi:hypothetical protein